MILYKTTDGKTVSEDTVKEVCKKIFEAIKTGLPKEVQSYEMCMLVIDKCKKELETKQIYL